MNAADGHIDTSPDAIWVRAHMVELRRLTDELESRLEQGDYLAAVASVQGLAGRVTDIGEFSGAQFSALTAESDPLESTGQYL